MKAVLRMLGRLWKAKTLSPVGLTLRAVLIALFFCTSELMGLREYTTFLSGTSGNVNLPWQTAALVGILHLVLYVGFILVAPTLLIAAGLLAAWNRWKGQREAAIQSLHFPDESQQDSRG